MRKILFWCVLLLASPSAFAQGWTPSGGRPLKLAEVIAGYKRDAGGDNLMTGGRDTGIDNKNLAFDKWEWYWRQHLDKDGFIVPSGMNVKAWQEYTEALPKAKTTSGMPANWIFQGPHTSPGGYDGMGRINVVAFDPVDSNLFYAGSASGGTWKTSDGGHSWVPLYDFLPTLGVTDIKVNPLNRNTIYVATGDAEAGDAYSAGVIVSHDAGATWAPSGLTWAPTSYNYIRSLLINPLDTNSIMVATNVGIYKSYNAGATWTNVAPGNFKQILYRPGDSTIVYGTIYTDTSAQIVRSLNGGLSWLAVTRFNNALRINIAVCPASPNIVKALACNFSSGLQGVYSSSDNGATYSATYIADTIGCTNDLLGYDLGLPTSSCGGKGWYAMCIAMNPASAADVTIGAINTYHSADGGASWQIANCWYDGGISGLAVVHANKHWVGYNSLSGALFEACDGGLYKTYNPFSPSWTDLSDGLCVTQFYRNAVDNGVTYCLGGSQGNGTKKLTTGVASELLGGNGTQPLINYGDPLHVFYCSLQYGYIQMTRDAWLHHHSITDALLSAGGFISPYLLHPSDTATLYLGYKNVYVSHNNGNSWAALSPVFDSANFINCLAISALNPDYIYAVRNEGVLARSVVHYTTNAGATWDTIHVPFTNLISSLTIDPIDARHIWVTISGYGAPKVYGYSLTTDIWTNESGTLPDLPVNCMVVDTVSRTRYIGTDVAVFYKDTVMTDWVLFNNHLPTAHVYDLHINYASGEIWAATFGRGMWKSNRADNPGTLSVAKLNLEALTIAPNPSLGAFTIFSTDQNLLQESVTIRLISADGRLVKEMRSTFDSAGKIKVNIKGLTPGVYVCEVTNNLAAAGAQIIIN